MLLPTMLSRRLAATQMILTSSGFSQKALLQRTRQFGSMITLSLRMELLLAENGMINLLQK